jgi:lipopolysaccharide cholinephosphotransferase
MDDTIKKLHAIDLDIVKEFVAICDEYNLTYYMIGGTLLGAIRHKGFIPWDDDVDLGMPRDDYEKFLEVSKQKLSPHLQVVNYRTDPKLDIITRIIDTTTKASLIGGNDSRYVNLYIDIFPLDGSPNFSIFRKLYYCRVMFHKILIISCYKQGINMQRKRNTLEKIFLIIFLKLPLENIINPYKEKCKIEKIMRKYRVEKSTYIGCLMGAYRTREMVPNCFYGKGGDYQFEDVKLRGPEQYDNFLTMMYGDYMKLPPIEARKTHFKILEIKGEKFSENKLKNNK